MIARLAVAEGHPLPERAEEFHQATGELLLSKMDELELLMPGEYDVTPKIWTKNTHNHELIVLDNGEGIYRLHPRDEGVGTLEYAPEADSGTYKAGGRQQRINAGNPFAVIAGGHPTKHKLQIFGIIAYLEGR
jgi:hypothetical protein